jgi:hypothetical protein
MDVRPGPAPRGLLRATFGLLLATVVLPVGAAEGQTDTTAPLITLHISGALGLNGWRVADTTVAWQFQDPESGIKETTGCDVRTISQETVGTDVTCRVTNKAGITVAQTVTVKLDKLPPRVRPRPTRPADANGWFNHRVAFTAGAADTASGIASCTRISPYGGPNDASVTVRARCTDRAGHSASGRRTFRYDETPPGGMRGVRGRPPDRYGWYASDLRVRFSASDGLSGMAGCSSPVYRGPDSSRAGVRGWCRDRAGNTSYRTVRFRFSKPLLHPQAGARLSTPPLLDWVDVPGALGYNAQLWRDGRKILSRWPHASRLDLDRVWSYAGKRRALLRGETYVWFVWPRFASGYGAMVGRSAFTFVRKPPELVAAVGLEPTTHGL